nr:YqhA family protein [Ktedonobacteraceae bacterium]
MLRRILASSRYLIIIAVLATFFAAIALLVYGGLTVFHVIYAMVVSSQFTTTEAKHISVEFIEIIDLFLLGTVLYIVSLGLYELFIDERIVMPHWLVITDLDALKGKLLGVIIVLLAVTFLGDVVTWDGSESILWLGLAIGLVLLALGYLLGRSIKPNQSEEPTRSTSEKEQE